ncbi:MAG: CHASE2 domain-containing protein [Chitinophagaceae bacterium]|nr:CHASE2 domain-containing protein [Chitinophagaceae bacterium]
MSHQEDNHHEDHHKPPKKKGIRHHARKVHGRVTKYLTERDTLFATIWVFIFIFALSQIPLNLGIMNPIKLGLKDFDFNDITYSKLGKKADTILDKRITLVNIGYEDREALSLMIDKVATYGPKVMALDALFDEEREPHKDSMLNATFIKHKNLVVARQLLLIGKEGDTVISDAGYFKTGTQAHVNLFTDSVSSVRYIEPFFIDHAGKAYNAFSTEIIKLYNPEAYQKLLKKKGKKLIINYSRKVDNYWVLEFDNIMNDGYDSSLIKDRIILFGYINTNKADLTDKFFTPMNERFAGKSIPDMNGVVIHANIISMALDKSYIKKVPLWGTLLLAFVVCWLHMSFFVHYYLESHIWFHLAAKIAQVLSGIFFIWLGIYLYDRYRLKVDMKLTIVTILMAVDVIYFYEAWAVWMHKKFNYKTVFKPHHH